MSETFTPPAGLPTEKYLVGSGQGEIWYVRANGVGSAHEKVSFVKGDFDAVGSDVSPDGRFVAYHSIESGQFEVYVRPFPQGGASGWFRPTAALRPAGGRTARNCST